MSGWISFRAPLEQYELQAAKLISGLQSGDRAVAWRFKWRHPRFHGKSVTEVLPTLGLDDARVVVAREHGFEGWPELAEFVEAISAGGTVAKFEEAVEAVVSGDAGTLRLLLNEDPNLIRARSTRRHHATLLHYIGANGVEDHRQKTPANAVEIARMLLDAGAEVDAVADLYDEQCTTMSLLVSSCHPAEAGLQVALAETLLDYGAAINGPGSRWQSSIVTALAFGYRNTAEALAVRGAPPDEIAVAAGLGRVADVARLLPASDAGSRHVALALAAQHGNAEVVRLLLDAGEDPNRFNPEGFHAHSTPLHQAAWSDSASVVRLLVKRGARLDIRDTLYQSTPLGWAIHGDRKEIADYLRSQGAPTT